MNFSEAFAMKRKERLCSLRDGPNVYLGIIAAFLVTIILKTEDAIKSADSLKIPFSLLLRQFSFWYALQSYGKSDFSQGKTARSSVAPVYIGRRTALGEAALLGAALLCVIFALRIRAYEAANDGVSIIEAYEGSGPSEEEFYEDRIADDAYASSHNRSVNNETATMLAWAGWLIILGMILLLFLAIFALLRHQ